MEYLRRNFNMSQLKAMVVAATRKGFTLVQGPPGTGKTKTLVGMLNTLHLVKFSEYQDGAVKMLS